MSLLGDVSILDIRTYRGFGRSFLFTIADQNGNPINITGYTWTINLYSLPINLEGSVSGTVVYTKSSPSTSLTVPTPTNGGVQWTMLTADSASLAIGTYGYQLIGTISGESYASLMGNVYHTSAPGTESP